MLRSCRMYKFIVHHQWAGSYPLVHVVDRVGGDAVATQVDKADLFEAAHNVVSNATFV